MNYCVTVYSNHEIFKNRMREYMETLKISGVKLSVKTIWCTATSLVMSEVCWGAQPLSNKDRACYIQYCLKTHD